MLTLTHCENILTKATKAEACKSNLDAAKRYFEAKDTEGFERVCRGNKTWLTASRIRYTLTDGLYERWYSDGPLVERCTYQDGKLDGLYERWYRNGQLAERYTYKDDNLNGLYENWYSNGQLCVRCTYQDDILKE